MKSFQKWMENQVSNEPLLQPYTLSGAEKQIRMLATNIRTTFGLDPKWESYKEQILAATQHLEEGANLLSKPH